MTYWFDFWHRGHPVFLALLASFLLCSGSLLLKWFPGVLIGFFPFLLFFGLIGAMYFLDEW
jgi:hypothetical protein